SPVRISPPDANPVRSSNPTRTGARLQSPASMALPCTQGRVPMHEAAPFVLPLKIDSVAIVATWSEHVQPASVHRPVSAAPPAIASLRSRSQHPKPRVWRHPPHGGDVR